MYHTDAEKGSQEQASCDAGHGHDQEVQAFPTKAASPLETAQQKLE
jgi:hypothetical protein